MKRGVIFGDIKEETSSKRDNENSIQRKLAPKDEKETDIDTVLLIPVFRNSLG